MRGDIAQQVRERLLADHHFKVRGDWLQQGRCPSCGKKELFTRADAPWFVRCGRENKCGWESSARDLYPDLFENFNKRFAPTTTDPNATANAYMSMARGFDLGLVKGWFEQGKFWHPNADRGTATVRFYLDEQRSIYMERFIEEVTLTDPETGEKTSRKAHFRGKHTGLWWAPPGLEILNGDEVWLVEACMDAIALCLNGVKAVAVLSCVNYPQAMLDQYAQTDVTWVWALDNDRAGKKWIRKQVNRMRKDKRSVAAAVSPARTKMDWSDLHQRNKLTAEDIEEYRHQGALLIAPSAADKALLMYDWDERPQFFFEFERRTFWFNLDIDKFGKARDQLADRGEWDEQQLKRLALMQCQAIAEIANCWVEWLYYQSNEVTDESWYYCRVNFPHGGAAIKNTFTAGQLAGNAEFKKRLLHIASGALWTGTSIQLDRILKLNTFNLKQVKTVDFIGYSREHGCWVFNELAVKDGRLYELNDEDFFDTGKLSIKSLAQSVGLHIGVNRGDYSTDWVRPFAESFGPNGIVALVFWFGTLFAEQIRAMHKSWPFLEVVGEAGSGKSTLIEFLWKLCGRRDYEGFDPSKSTLAARARNFAQVANLPVVLIEGDREEDTAKSKRFDWDELKTAYNGRSVRARGHKNSGNETYEPPFRGAIVISQNADVNASDAVLQRIVHLYFDKSAHTLETKAAAERLERWPMEELSYFVVDAVLRASRVLEVVRERTPHWESAMLGMAEIKSVRIAKNHAQLIALTEAIGEMLPLGDDLIDITQGYIINLAKERQQAINLDHPVVQQFWETFDYLDEAQSLNHSRDPDLIAVNLNHFIGRAAYANQQVPLLMDLKKHLRSSRARKFVDTKTVNSAIQDAKSVRAWVFRREG